MTPFAIALALLAQDPAGQEPASPVEAAPIAAAATAPQDRLPPGAPREDYPFVAWCYGALRGYVDLHDEMMPEVTRIEAQFRKPGTKLEDDLKVYADMQRDGRKQLQQLQAALTAAEKASVRPINAVGAVAVRQGRQIWNAGPEVTKARKAQEWMSWTLPARCETVSTALETRSKLLGATLRVNAEEGPARTSATDDQTVAAAAPVEATVERIEAEQVGAEQAGAEASPTPETPVEGGEPSAF